MKKNRMPIGINGGQAGESNANNIVDDTMAKE